MPGLIDGGLRNIFKENLRTWHWQSLETGAYAPGVPDVNACKNGREVWIEFKRTSALAVKFRPLQPGWILKRSSVGGNVYVAIRVIKKDVDDLLIYAGTDVLALQKHGIRVTSYLGKWSGGPKQWDWTEVNRALGGT